MLSLEEDPLEDDLLLLSLEEDPLEDDLLLLSLEDEELDEYLPPPPAMGFPDFVAQ